MECTSLVQKLARKCIDASIPKSAVCPFVQGVDLRFGDLGGFWGAGRFFKV